MTIAVMVGDRSLSHITCTTTINRRDFLFASWLDIFRFEAQQWMVNIGGMVGWQDGRKARGALRGTSGWASMQPLRSSFNFLPNHSIPTPTACISCELHI
ncbi:hypothetical protein N7G274_009442 [Stereocaulon virgatum]|uniref:Uncharacterized protein n=1 Tax=Stereocaulon virgatum TaxID=373712 RepID=A0ABR3ZVU2_9LECA